MNKQEKHKKREANRQKTFAKHPRKSKKIDRNVLSNDKALPVIRYVQQGAVLIAKLLKADPRKTKQLPNPIVENFDLNSPKYVVIKTEEVKENE